MIYDFLRAMHKYVPEDARIMMCSFRGDPNDDIPGKWVSRTLTKRGQLDFKANIYLAVSAMGKNERGEFRRRKENFRGGLLLMIDDLGTGKGAKFPMSLLNGLIPTALIETSPDNFQAVYMFDRLVEDRGLFERLIHGFIEKQFLGKDTGMAGVNRVFRPPAGINGKRKYRDAEGNPWEVRMAQWNPDARYSVEQIAQHFSIDLTPPNPHRIRGATESKADNIRAFVSVRAALRSAGMIKSEHENLEGWIDIVCPWTAEHTGGVDNGASIRVPDEENGWHGAFKCHHGGCQERGWRELTDWLASNQETVLEAVNEKGFDFKDLF